MKDKEKQIEEMAEILCESKEHNCNGKDCKCLKQATDLFNKGVRILSEDDIILTETERITMCVEQWDKGYAQGSKKTAEKILNEILFVKGTKDWQENEQLVEFGNRIVDKIEEFAKQYSIKIKE